MQRVKQNLIQLKRPAAQPAPCTYAREAPEKGIEPSRAQTSHVTY